MSASDNAAEQTEIDIAPELVGAFVLAQMIAAAHSDASLHATIGSALRLLNITLSKDKSATLTRALEEHSKIHALRNNVQEFARAIEEPESQ